MSNPVILVSSCKKDADSGNNQAIRQSWGKNSAIPYFFILGEGNAASADEIVFPVKDDYLSLPHKTKEGHRWARENGYDWIFQCFTDTYVDTERLAKSGFESGHFVGNKGAWPPHARERAGLEFCHGGPGYWLSPKASDLIISADIGRETLEDQWVAAVMKANNILILDDKRYSMGTTYNFREPVPMPNNNVISCHLSDSGHKYTASLMFAAERKRLTGR
jgi:hypothetical protein